MAELEKALRRQHEFRALLVPDTSSDGVAARYNEWAETYDQDMKYVQAYDGPFRMAEIVGEVCHDKDSEIVDWGSGTGLVGVELHEKGFTNLTAADISEKVLDVAAKKNVYKRTVTLGDSKLLFRNDAFDAAVCCGAIIPNHVKPDIFHEWIRIVKPGGLIVVVMRREYIQLTKGYEQYYSEELEVELGKVIDDLVSEKKLEMMSTKDFVGRNPVPPQNFHGRAFVFKVTG